MVLSVWEYREGVRDRSLVLTRVQVLQAIRHDRMIQYTSRFELAIKKPPKRRTVTLYKCPQTVRKTIMRFSTVGLAITISDGRIFTLGLCDHCLFRILNEVQ